MLQLPIGNKGQFDFLNKPIPNPVDLVNKKPFTNKIHFKLPKKLLVSLTAFVLVSVVVYFGASYLYPILTKKKSETTTIAKVFEYSVDIGAISFPNDALKEKFVANFKNASGEKDSNKRYKLLEDNFVTLLGLYSASARSDYRVQLDKFKEYMKKNYPKKVEENKNLYDFPCIDKLCGAVKSPAEIVAIRGEITKEEAINSQVKEAILRNFDAAGLNSGSQEENYYLSAYSMLVSERNRTKDEKVKVTTVKMYDFMIKSYPQLKIPEDLKP